MVVASWICGRRLYACSDLLVENIIMAFRVDILSNNATDVLAGGLPTHHISPDG